MTRGRNVQQMPDQGLGLDDKAFEELYDRFAPRLFGMVFQILADRSAAAEVLEEAFLRLWSQARRSARAGANLGVWLTITARRLAVDRRRAEQKLPPLNWNGVRGLERFTSWLPPSDEIAQLDQRSDLLKKVIQQLPGPQRRALDLAVFGGHSEKEIADQLHEPLGRTKTELRAAMTFLRHRLRAVSGTWAANI